MSDNSASANIVQSKTNDSSTVSAPKPGNGLSKLLLIEECSANEMPKVFNILMTSLDNPTKKDIIVVLLYILTVESGFTPSCCKPLEDDFSAHYDARRLNALTEIPPSWKGNDGLYELKFFLQPFSDEKCHLVCNTTLNQLSVSMFLCDACDSLQTFSMFVNPAKYICCVPKSKKFKFKNLKELSVTFKNQITLPIKSCILAKSNLYHGLLALPEEILYKVFDYLDSKSFVRLTSTCKGLYDNFSNDIVIWKRLLNREFTDSMIPSGDVNWKTFYIENYKTRESKMLEESRMLMSYCIRPNRYMPILNT